MTPVFANLLFASVALAAAVISSFGLLALRPRIEDIGQDRNDHRAVQASHVGDPLRLGGVAVAIGLVVGTTILAFLNHIGFGVCLIISLIPVFVAGVLEDLGFHVSAKRRFLASLVAAAVAIGVFGYWVPRGDLFFLDSVFGVTILAIPLTMLVAGVFCHAVNLIDGMNGLAGSVSTVAAIGLAVIASRAGLPEVASISWIIAAASVGFLVLNWPSAKLFLGDAGAYGLGHVLVWVGISIVALNMSVAVSAVILVLFYPFADTIHTVVRRLVTKKNVMQPDRMHLHQKIRRTLEVAWLGRNQRAISNPLTTAILLPVIVAPVVTGILLWNQPGMAWAMIAFYAAMFTATNYLVAMLAKRFRMNGCDPCVGSEWIARASDKSS